MASSANPNPQPQPQPQPQVFDMHKFFKPSAPPPHSNPPPPGSLQNPSPPPMPFPIPPASYPPPSAAGFNYPQQTAPFHHPYQYQFYQNPNPHHILPPNQIPFAPEQRSLSFPAPPLQPPPMANNSPNSGARIMALLGAQTANVEFPPPPVATESPGAMGGPARMSSSKLPKGRHLGVEHAVYDVDVRLAGEVQPQLEVTPITKYGSDPQLVLGRQIAVNKSYICYGLKQGNIRVLNIHTALRALFRAHTQRVTDMAFFAEDVHLLASVSVEGRLYVWKISEGPDEEGTPQITGKIMVALHIVGEDEALHPRICWHCHKQEMLVVGYGKRVLRIDTTKFGKGEAFSAEEPLKCHVEKLIDGVQFVGKHDGEITDLSMCQWMVTRLLSASMDGTIKIWEDRKAQPLAVLRPHDGQPVNAATFLTAPHRPDHIVLITAGPLNREVKVWASASEEGWLLPSDAESWKNTQTLELKSSVEQRVEDAFFNQVISLPQAGLLLLANAKKNAIYAIHVEYGPNPISTCMDYIAEFTVTMPILSFTGTSITPQGEHILQVYCVQTQAIQQYALDLSQCLPPPFENSGFDRSESNLSATEAFSAVDRPVSPALKPNAQAQIGSSSESALRYPGGSNPIEVVNESDIVSPNTESNPAVLTPSTSNADITGMPSPPPPLSPRLSGRFSGLRAPVDNFGSGSLFSDHVGEPVNNYSVDRQVDQAQLSDVLPVDDESRNDERKASQDDFSSAISPSAFKYPTHLITPSEIFMASSSPATPIANEGKGGSEGNIQDVLVNGDADNSELEVRAAEESSFHNDSFGVQEESQNAVSESNEKYFCSQASDLGLEMARECCAISSDTHIAEDPQHLAEPSHVNEEDQDSIKDVSARASQTSASPAAVIIQTPNTKVKKKGKGSHASSSSPSLLNSVDSSSEAGVTSSLDAVASPQIFAMQETLNQLMSMQKEMQKQISMMVALPVAKEGKRLEAAFGRSMEKSIKANNDALWARIQEENAKAERLSRERSQQTTAMVSNFMSKDLPALLEKTLKKEMATVGPAVVRAISPAIEKTIYSAIADSFQRGVGDKAVTQLEKSVNSRLETTVARQIQAQFQTSGRQALQETLKSSFEVMVIPAFEMSCKAMFEQVDATFQKGISEHANANNQYFDAAQSHLAHTLREAINAASSVAQTLSGELADGQRKLIALAAAGGNTSGGDPLISQLSNGPLGAIHDKVEAPLDPTKELSRLISEHKYDEAFNRALQRSDVNIVSWLCSQVDVRGILSMAPLPLSQGVLLSLLQQLACDISNDPSRKIGWMTDVAAAINPADPMIAVHVRPIFEQVYNILHNQRSLPSITPPDQTSIKLLMHVINSMIMTCK